MAYGQSIRAFIEEGPVEQAAKMQSLRSTARSWRALSEPCRLALIEQAVRAAHNDEFPLAL